MKKKKILLFTGGGGAPALNATLFGVITTAQTRGYQIFGGLYGWKSIASCGKIVDLTKTDVSSIIHFGGSFLRSSRTNPYAMKNGITELKKRLREEHIDTIIAIGGDDTLGVAERLFREEDISINGIPKTIDNDLSGTYWAPGFPTAASIFSDYVRKIRIDAAYSLQRVYVIESLGMKSGWLASSSTFGNADIIVPPEKQVKVNHLLEVIKDRYNKNGQYAVVVLSENGQFDDFEGETYDSTDMFKHKRRTLLAVSLGHIIKKKLKIDSRIAMPGNIVQTGPAISIDAQTAQQLGARAIDLIDKNMYGRMPSIERKNHGSCNITISDQPLSDAVGEDKLRKMDDSWFDYDTFSVKQTYLDYMKPILGVPDMIDRPYDKLIKTINNI